jgi:hypothetical protein
MRKSRSLCKVPWPPTFILNKTFYFLVGFNTCNGGDVQQIVRESFRCSSWGRVMSNR